MSTVARKQMKAHLQLQTNLKMSQEIQAEHKRREEAVEAHHDKVFRFRAFKGVCFWKPFNPPKPIKL